MEEIWFLRLKQTKLNVSVLIFEDSNKHKISLLCLYRGW